MSSIPCDTCMDLMPLVRDGVASEDSVRLVEEHVRGCPACRQRMEQRPDAAAPMDEGRVIKKMKKQVVLAVAAVVTAGALFGIGLSESGNVFYNVMIMPLLGGVCFLFFRRGALAACAGVFALSYVWNFASASLNGSFVEASVQEALSMPLWWAAIYAGLWLFGIVIAALLRYAFGKEGSYEKSN